MVRNNKKEKHLTRRDREHSRKTPKPKPTPRLFISWSGRERTNARAQNIKRNYFVELPYEHFVCNFVYTPLTMSCNGINTQEKRFKTEEITSNKWRHCAQLTHYLFGRRATIDWVWVEREKRDYSLFYYFFLFCFFSSLPFLFGT